MQIDTVKKFVSSHGVQSHHEFTIKAGAKAFELLIAGLYSDRLKAFIRELSTNAYEAHQYVGLESKPFDVTLPTYSNHNFTIRDYGPGLSPSDVKKIYTVIFESTKDESNDLGGCFGLGSKSPFAYVEQSPFTVTSIWNGKKYFYSCYRNADGIPSMDLLQETDSDEPTGIEISVPIKRNDIGYAVKQKCSEVYSWFDLKPNITNDTLVYQDNFKPSIVLTSPNFTIHNGNSINYVKMGNILYPLDFNLIKCPKKFYGIIIYAPIGSVIPDPSRERLTYNPHTIGYLQQVIEEANDFVTKKVEQDISAAKTYFEAMKLAIKYTSGFPNMRINDITYNNKPLGNTEIKLLCGEVHEITYNRKIRKDNNAEFSYRRDIPLYVSNDAIAHMTRIKDFLNANSQYNTVVICEKGKEQNLADEIGINVSDIMLASSMPYVPPLKGTKRGPSNAHKTRVLQYIGGNGTTAWKDISINIATETGYYVEYFNNKCKIDNRQYSPESIIGPTLALLGLPSTTVVYGIKSELMAKKGNTIKNMKNLLTEGVLWYSNNMKTVQNHVADSNTYNMINHRFIQRFSDIVKKHNLTVSNDCSEFLKSYENIKIGYRFVDKHEYTLFTLTQKCVKDASLNHAKVVSYARQLENKYSLLSALSQYIDTNGDEIKYYLLGKGL